MEGVRCYIIAASTLAHSLYEASCALKWEGQTNGSAFPFASVDTGCLALCSPYILASNVHEAVRRQRKRPALAGAEGATAPEPLRQKDR
jgi:hypothetical protein